MGRVGATSGAVDPIPGIPSGTVTFLFTDVARSTHLWENHPDDMSAALVRHDQIVRDAIESSDGYIFSLAGDQFVAAFHRVGDALDAASAAQTQLAAEPWPATTPIRIRIGIHSGEAEERDNDYFGPVLNRTARIVGAIHPGQTVLSSAAAELADSHGLMDLGAHRLKDLAAQEQLWQVGTERFPALRSLRENRHNLPVERTPLIGRSNDIAAIVKTLDRSRLVTLLGIGGSGKTRLATAVAAEVEDRFPDGVWFVDLVPTADQEGVVEAIASAVGLRLTGTDLLGALTEQADRKNFLLVLDNCEHVTDDVADVVDVMMERTDSVQIIATSREPLDLEDEHQVRVEPLAVAASSWSPAIRLFNSAAARVGAEPSIEDIDVVAEICKRLDGLPLSIELAAAQLRQLTLAELVERLDRRFELLTRGRGGRRKRRHASVLEVLDDSWSMLDAGEQRLLMYLAAFPSSFELIDVEGLVGDRRGVVSELGGLADRGLVSSNGEGANRLLETVKLFVRGQWEHDDEPSSYLEAHTRWLVNYIYEHGEANDYQSASLAGWVIHHYDDHRAVEERLASSGRFDELAHMIGGIRWAYSRETGQRAAAFIERVERYVDQLELSASQSAALHLAAAGAARAARDRRWLAHGSSEAVRLYRLDGDSTELVVALIVASFTEVLRNPEQAFANLEEAQSIARNVGAETLVDTALAYRAHYAAMIGSVTDVHEALAELEPRLNSDVIDNTRIMALQAKMIAHLTSDPSVARSAAQECFASAARLGLDHDWWMHLYLAMGAAATGDASDMRTHLVDAELLLEQSGTDGLPDLLLPYAALAHVRGEAALSQRMITAVRHASARPGTGVVIGLYRHLRTEIGLDSQNPLESDTLERIHHAARSWATALESLEDQSTPV